MTTASKSSSAERLDERLDDTEFMARNEEVVDDTSASTDAGVNELRLKTSGIGLATLALLNCCSPGSEAAVASDFSPSGPLDQLSLRSKAVER